MHIPQLTPLQSRLAASLAASLCLVVIFFSLFNPTPVYAADDDTVDHSSHDDNLLRKDSAAQHVYDNLDWRHEEESFDTYEPEFAGVDRGIIGRAPVGITALANNDPQNLNIDLGESNYWVFPNASLWGNFSAPTAGLPSDPDAQRRIKRDKETDGFLEDDEDEMEEDVTTSEDQVGGNRGSRKVYITLNTCLQPSANGSDIPPPLELYVSTSQRNQRPGPKGDDSRQTMMLAEDGFANITVDATGDVYVGVSASNSTSFKSIYNYELAASIDAPYHSVEEDEPNLFLVDSDSFSALLITNNLTTQGPDSAVFKQWMNMTPPFMMYAHNINDTAINGLSKSFCGLQHKAQISTAEAGLDSNQVQTGMTTRGLGNKPKEQFFIHGLNGTSAYYGILAMQGNSTKSGAGVVGGGGKVWQPMNFTTMSDGNCQVIFNLSFCSEVAYAVPSNPQKFSNVTALTQLYDSNAASLYQYFNYSLQQIPCNTTSSAQYSLVRNCTDCAREYKQWLCAVTIPRCADFSSLDSFLWPRNIGGRFINGTLPDPSAPAFEGMHMNWTAQNQSRVSLIDTEIQPGPYKEILPCGDLCYSLVQSCPASLGFQCPLKHRGMDASYGTRDMGGKISCSYLGAYYYMNAAPRAAGGAPTTLVLGVVGLWSGLLFFL
ncbi:MAG: hypothetical protein M1819_007186 [Sarea resinae]|nr:MAG: hypothetical protein M1819_007186 [Sarea resinae]